jgi:hypothetical protein
MNRRKTRELRRYCSPCDEGGAEPGSADRSRQVPGMGWLRSVVSPQVMRLLIKTVRGSGYVFAAAAVAITLPSTNVRSPGSYDG